MKDFSDYELIDHTADIGIIVEANGLKSLFTKAAAAMFSVMMEKTKPIGQARKKKTAIDINAENLKELLVRWLSELLSLSDCKKVIFTDFKISALTRTHIKAEIFGAPQSLFKPLREIKAVTYHALVLKEAAGTCRAEVIFDV